MHMCVLVDLCTQSISLSTFQMYADIAQTMRSEGFTVTAQGCRHKFNKLMDRYKRVKDHNSKTG